MPRHDQITEQLIGALVPQTTIPRPAAAPMPALPPSAPGDRPALGMVEIGTSRVDGSGRIVATALLKSLSWRPGDVIEIDVCHGAVVIAPRADGRHRVGDRGEIGLPTQARALCAITTGSTVFMAALVNHGLLVIHRADAVIRALGRVHQRIVGGRDAC